MIPSVYHYNHHQHRCPKPFIIIIGDDASLIIYKIIYGVLYCKKKKTYLTLIYTWLLFLPILEPFKKNNQWILLRNQQHIRWCCCICDRAVKCNFLNRIVRLLITTTTIDKWVCMRFMFSLPQRDFGRSTCVHEFLSVSVTVFVLIVYSFHFIQHVSIDLLLYT